MEINMINIPVEEYKNLVAIKSRVEAMVDYALNKDYARLEECLLILGIKKENDGKDEE